MSEVLVPFTDFSAYQSRTELADRLHKVAKIPENREDLLQRHLLGPANRYGVDADTARESLERAYNFCLKGELGAFAVMSAQGNAEGIATVYPGLELHVMRAPLPPKLALGPLKAKVLTEKGWDMNIAAWAFPEREDNQELHARVYERLIEEAAEYASVPKYVPWTIEPERSERWVHQALQVAGLSQLGETARYDDQETNRHVPPLSRLYRTVALKHQST